MELHRRVGSQRDRFARQDWTNKKASILEKARSRLDAKTTTNRRERHQEYLVTPSVTQACSIPSVTEHSAHPISIVVAHGAIRRPRFPFISRRAFHLCTDL